MGREKGRVGREERKEGELRLCKRIWGKAVELRVRRARTPTGIGDAGRDWPASALLC